MVERVPKGPTPQPSLQFWVFLEQKPAGIAFDGLEKVRDIDRFHLPSTSAYIITFVSQTDSCF
jgi:hypothetical protein